MAGTVNAQQLKSIIDKAEAFNIITGSVGTFSVSLGHAVAAASPLALEALAPVVPAGVAAVAPLAPGEASLVASAAAQSNAAATTTPSAASGTPTTANTPATTISNAAKGITGEASTPADLKTFETGASATLHWWGWSLQLTEKSTKALSSLLTTDLGGFVTIATALAALSAPLAAAAAIVSAAATGFNDWITAADSNHNGVTIDGYLWVGVWVQGV